MTAIPSSAPLPPGGTVLLLGAGQLGTALGLRLLASGHRVVAVRRGISSLPVGFEAIAADATSGALPALPSAHAAVITLPPLTLPGGGNGTAAAIRALAAALPRPPARTVLVSSTRVFDGAGPDAVLSEADLPVPGSERAKALLETENVAVELLNALVLRPAGIYGPGRDYLVRAVRGGTPQDHGRRTNRIHEADLVRALHLLLDAENPPRVLHAVDSAPATLGDVLVNIAGLLGLPVPPQLDEQNPAPAAPNSRGASAAHGRVMSGERFAAFMGHLDFPDHHSGYAQMLAT